MRLKPGTRLGSCQIVSPLGAGGMGEVYKARDLKLGRDVAVKVLREELARDPGRLKRFEQEARSASALNHPNIVTVYEIGQHGNTLYIGMEFVEGKTLRELLADGPLPTKKLLHLATQIAEGLTKAHAVGIVHRDLKPENLMVTNDGYVKILDFGLAKLQGVPSALDSEMTTTPPMGTPARDISGTVQYMSPEQAAGRSADYRSDQFSFGCILYEMATGKLAFQRETVAQTMAAIIENEPERIAALNPKLPAHLGVIVKRCLAKDPEERYESTKDLAKERELESGEESPLGLSTPPVSDETKHWRPRRLAVVGVLLAVLALVTGLNVGGLRDRLLGRLPPPSLESLAVLPLENLSGDPELEYFADGMTEALIAELGQIAALDKVTSRTSVMQYKNTSKTLWEIGRELGVEAAVEGSVTRDNERVRITARLIHARTETHLWSGSFEEDFRDILALQGKLARIIAEEIRVELTPQEQARLTNARPVNPEAYDTYLRGRFFLEKRTSEALERGLEYFQRAIELDPTFAASYSGLADSYMLLRSYGLLPPEQAYPSAKDAALKALEFDESLAEAHTSLAGVLADHEWKWLRAETEYKRAIALNPNYATAHQWYATLLQMVGRVEEAIAVVAKAKELAPLSLRINTEVGWAFYWARKYDRAIEVLHKTLELDPSFAPAREYLGWAYIQKGMYPEAIEQYETAERLGLATATTHLAHALAVSGRSPAALELAAELKSRYKQHLVSPFGIALIYTGLGEHTEALVWLERAYVDRDYWLGYIKVEPRFDTLRSTARFQALLDRMDFPE